MRFLLLFVVLLSGCSTIKRPFLYSAEKDGKQIILLGTIHLGVSARDLPGRVHDEMKTSKVAFFETDFEDFESRAEAEGDDEAEHQLFVNTYFRDTGGSFHDAEAKLSERLSKKTWEKLRARLPDFSPDFLDDLKPKGALLYVVTPKEERLTQYEANSLNPNYSMDYRLYGWAKDAGVRTLQLDQESDVCKEEREQTEIKNLELELSGQSINVGLGPLWQLIEAYREGDEAKVLRFDNEQEHSKEYACLLTRRNRDWLELVENYPLKGEKIFVAAGVAHMLSKRYPSLLTLLSQRGYKVTRLTP